MKQLLALSSFGAHFLFLGALVFFVLQQLKIVWFSLGKISALSPKEQKQSRLLIWQKNSPGSYTKSYVLAKEFTLGREDEADIYLEDSQLEEESVRFSSDSKNLWRQGGQGEKRPLRPLQRYHLQEHEMMWIPAGYAKWLEYRMLAFAQLVCLLGWGALVLTDPTVYWPSWKFFLPLLGLWWVASWSMYQRGLGSDPQLLPCACVLTGLGLMLQMRLNYELAPKQALWYLLGIVVFILMSSIFQGMRHLDRYPYLFLLVALVLQCGLLLFGTEINGAKNWYRFGSYSLQPIEFVKIFFVVFLAGFFRRFRYFFQLDLTSPQGRLPRRSFLIVVAIWAFLAMVLVVQKDLGMTLLLTLTFGVLFLVTCGRWDIASVMILSGTVAGLLASKVFSHVQTRIDAWWNPFAFFDTGGYQMSQALFAMAEGGWLGQGWNQGQPNFIPEVHNDFIFIALAEELGFIGCFSILLVSSLLVYRGLRLSIEHRHEFCSILGFGLTAMLAIQIFLIVGGTTRLIPMTGLTLPFVSYGGSSTLASFMILSLLRRLSRGR